MSESVTTRELILVGKLNFPKTLPPLRFNKLQIQSGVNHSSLAAKYSSWQLSILSGGNPGMPSISIAPAGISLRIACKLG